MSTHALGTSDDPRRPAQVGAVERRAGRPADAGGLPGRADGRGESVDDGAGVGGVRRVARNLDLVAVAGALPVFLVADLPLLGWGAVAAAWGAHRLIGALALRAATSRSARASTGLLAISMFGRVWLVALAVLAAGLVEREAGLPAAVLAFVAFQIYLPAQMLSRRPPPGGAR